jgi:hypothetical protein
MSTGADAKTMPVTAEYEDGYERTFGKREPVRGHWVYDANGVAIPAEQYVPEDRHSVGDGIASGRFYDGVRVAGSGEDISTRQKHREYMKRNGLTTADDFTETWAKAEKERENMRQGIFPDDRERRNEIGRIAYEVEKRERAKRR